MNLFRAVILVLVAVLGACRVLNLPAWQTPMMHYLGDGVSALV
jgi:hypothetical protein